MPHEVPERPWQKLGTDLFEFQGQNYLCVVDYFSKFPEICLLETNGRRSLGATFATRDAAKKEKKTLDLTKEWGSRRLCLNLFTR